MVKVQNPSVGVSERDIETKLLVSLFTQTLGYPFPELRFDVPVSLTFGREKLTKKADLVAYHGGQPVIVVEAKKPTETLEAGMDQVDSYAFALKCRYSIVTNGRKLILRGYYSFNSRITILEANVDQLQRNEWKALVDLLSYEAILGSISEKENKVQPLSEEKIRDYRRFFRALHTVIRDRDKLDPAASFDEMSKLLFLKAAEEEWTAQHPGQTMLTPEKIEEWERIKAGEGLNYVNKWFASTAASFYPDVFEENTRINLSVETLKEVLAMMRGFHPKQGDVDVKGRAFEEFLPTQMRGKGLGQFFTPRPVVSFMVDLADISMHDTVGDFACGSGGFLIAAFERMQRLIAQLPNGTWERLGISKEEFVADMKNGQLHGIDAEPRCARTAKMNMLMWGDGRKVVRGNGLDEKDYNGKPYEPGEYDPKKKGSGSTVVLANPPFGSSEKEQHILERYTLGSKDAERATQKTEILFLEKGLKMLRPQGKMLIVIPQGILSNESYAYVRDFLHSEAEIRAIVSLPTHAFVQSGVVTVKTCVLYVQKFTEEKKKLYDEKTKGKTAEEIRKFLRSDPAFDYSFFLGSAEFIGYEPSGRSNVKPGEKTDLDLLLEDIARQQTLAQPDVDLIEFARVHYAEASSRRGEQQMRGSHRGLKTSFTLRLSDTVDRLDPPFYLLRSQAGAMLEGFTPLASVIEEHSERFRPKTEDEKDEEYPMLSVTNDGRVSLSDHLPGGDFTQSYKKVHAGDIVYNPYRVNIGSIGAVPEDCHGALVSPAYVVFRALKHDPQFLVDLLRSPFYKMVIDVVSTGSIRDSLSFDLLSTIRIPPVSVEEQHTLMSGLRDAEASIEKLLKDVDVRKEGMVERLHALLHRS